MIDIITLAVGFCCDKARCPSVLTFSVEHPCNGMTVIAARLPSYGKLECVTVCLPCHNEWTYRHWVPATLWGYARAFLTLRVEKDVEAYPGHADCAFLSLRPSEDEPNSPPESSLESMLQ